MVSLRLVRPVAVSKGKQRVINAFDLCQGSADGGNSTNITDGEEEAEAAPATRRRRLLQEEEAAEGDGENATQAIDANDASTCPPGKRYRIVTTAQLFPDEMMALAGGGRRY